MFELRSFDSERLRLCQKRGYNMPKRGVGEISLSDEWICQVWKNNMEKSSQDKIFRQL